MSKKLNVNHVYPGKTNPATSRSHKSTISYAHLFHCARKCIHDLIFFPSRGTQLNMHVKWDSHISETEYNAPAGK